MNHVINRQFQAIGADDPQGKTPLWLYPILDPSHDEPDYRLLHEQMPPHVSVTETSQSGNVAELTVENRLDVKLSLIDRTVLHLQMFPKRRTERLSR